MRQLHRVILVTALAATFSSGCLTASPRRTTPEIKDNGAPLEVRTSMADHRVWNDDLKMSFKDGTQEEVFLGFFQGDKQILDELDFYAVAQDEARMAEVIDWREKSNRTLYAAIGVQAVGVLVVASGIGVGAYGFSVDPDNIGTSPYYAAALGLVIGGSILVGAAPSVLWSLIGPETELIRELETTPLVLSWRTAQGSADDFNRKKQGDAAPADGGDPAVPGQGVEPSAEAPDAAAPTEATPE